jgi:hypothetical protein
MEAEGLTGVILFENHIWAKWSLSHALGGVRLVVPSAMAEAAFEVLERINSGVYENLLIEEQGLSKLTCPRCGSVNTGVHAWVWKLALVVMFTLSLVIPYTSHLHSCDNCKYSWVAREQRPYPLIVIAIYMAITIYCFYIVFIAFGYIFEWKMQ